MMTETHVLEVIDLLERLSVIVWLDGGWAVDALVQEQTREHDDLDLVLRAEDAELAISALAGLGYRMHLDYRPTRFVLADVCDRRIDFHPVVFDEKGDAVQKGAGPNGSDAPFPASGFRGRGAVAGRPMPCLTPDLLVLFHTGYAPKTKDTHNVRLLCDRFGIPLPPAYR